MKLEKACKRFSVESLEFFIMVRLRSFALHNCTKPVTQSALRNGENKKAESGTFGNT
jgi:hypothetical protein